MRAIMVSLFVVMVCLPAFAVTQIDPGMNPVVVIPLDDANVPGGGNQMIVPIQATKEPAYQTREGLEKAARMVLSGELTVHVDGSVSPKQKTTVMSSRKATAPARAARRAGVSTSTVRRIARAMLGDAIGTHDENVDAHADAFAAHDNAPGAHQAAFGRHNADPRAHAVAIGQAINNHDANREAHQDIRGMVDSAFWRLFLLMLLVATLAVAALLIARGARATANATATASASGGGSATPPTPPTTPPATSPAGTARVTTREKEKEVLVVELDDKSSSRSTPPPPAAPAATGRTLVIRPEEVRPVQPLDVQLDTPPPHPPARRARRQRRQPQV